MFPDHVFQVLLADNPWLEGSQQTDWITRHLPERYVPRQQAITVGDDISLILGPRQVGKSTLIWKTLSDLGQPILYVNCEEPAIREWSTSPALFTKCLIDLVASNTIVFFEEVQQLSDAGLFLKGLVDRKSGFRFVATGSSSYELQAKTRESLAGRADRHLLLPFMLDELISKTTTSQALRAKQLGELAEHLVVYGGYPSVYLSQDKEKILTGLLESFIIRDASDRFRIQRIGAFRKLLSLIASQIGNLCNYSEWAAITGVSGDTVSEYAQILSDTHIIRMLRPFVGGKRAEITSAPKAYFIDNGIRNRVFGGFAPLSQRPDRGALLENFVFCELYKNLSPLVDSIKYWRSKSGAEVDFVIEHNGTLFALEIKAGASRGKLSRSSHSFIDAYQPKYFWVVSNSSHDERIEGHTQVRFISFQQLHCVFEQLS